MQLNATPFYTVKMASSGKKRAAHETDESGGDSINDIGFNARGEIYCFETKIYWFARPNLLVKGIER